MQWNKSDSLGIMTTSLVVSPGDHIFVGTTTNGIYRSTDGGIHWNVFNIGFETTDTKIRSLTLAHNGSVIVGTDHGIYRGVK